MMEHVKLKQDGNYSFLFFFFFLFWKIKMKLNGGHIESSFLFCYLISIDVDNWWQIIENKTLKKIGNLNYITERPVWTGWLVIKLFFVR